MKNLLFALLLASAVCSAQTPAFQFSSDSAYAALRVLASDIGPRPMGSPAEQRAMAFAVAEFSRYGCDTSYIMPMTDANGVNTRSGVAVGIHRGRTGRIIVIGGHIDSASPEIAGANDDGSGSATVIELARVLARRETNSTILFCCWGGEEEGLRGSTYFVDHFPQIDSVDLMLQIDMADGQGYLEADPDASYERSAPSWLPRAAFDIFYNDLHFEGLRYSTQYMTMNYAGRGGSGSDHIPFIEKGIPAIDFTSDLSYPIHTPLDNLATFDSSGLHRSGLLVQRLVERFDDGVPSRAIEKYWLLNPGHWLIFVPHSLLSFVLGVAIVLALVGMITRERSRRRMVAVPAETAPEHAEVLSMSGAHDGGVPQEVTGPATTKKRIHWSGFKLLVVTLFIQVCVWLPSTLVGVATGLRFPWVNNLAGFVVLSIIGGIVGIWISLRFVGRFRISANPLPLYGRALVLLLLFTGLLLMVSVELAVYPAIALALIALAMLVPDTWMKTLFVVLSPVMLLRLIFFEPLRFLFMMLTMPMGDVAISRTIFDVALIIMFTIVSLPFVYAFAALYREVPEAAWPVRRFRAWPALAVFVVAGVILAFYLAGRPTYDERWEKSVRVTQQYDIDKDSGYVRLNGGEYLDRLQLTYGGKDTVLTGHLQLFTLPLSKEEGSVAWCSIDATQSAPRSSDEKDVEVTRTLTVRSAIRPLSVSVTYHSSGSVNVSSPWVTGRRGRMPVMSDTLQSFAWYAFPDSELVIPITFRMRWNQELQEEVEVIYDRLAYPVTLSRPLTYAVQRTIVHHTALFSTGETGD